MESGVQCVNPRLIRDLFHESAVRKLDLRIGEITAEAGISDNRVKSLISLRDISGLSDGELEKIWEVVQRKRG